MNEMSAHGGDAVRFDISPLASTQQADSAPRRARRRPGENRERLLVAGISVFGTYGYHGAQTAAIAALAEVPQPHVYANFSTKQELFLACAERVCDLIELSAHDQSAAETVPGAKRSETAGDQGSWSDTAHGAFLLQCVAASAEAKLQPELGELLWRLRRRVGEQRVLDLLAVSARDILHKNCLPTER